MSKRAKTRREAAIERRKAWAHAVNEGRVVVYDHGARATAFLTEEQAQAALRLADALGIVAELAPAGAPED